MMDSRGKGEFYALWHVCDPQWNVPGDEEAHARAQFQDLGLTALDLQGDCDVDAARCGFALG
jgi:hypothetical protein